MGIIISKVLDRIYSKKNCKILMLGLDAAGKTTILYNLKVGEVIQSVPTIGFNCETVWDIGGQGKIRDLWHHYFKDASALIYVVDSSDEDRMEIVRESLYQILQDENLQNIPVLVFANKQDLSRLQFTQIVENLKLTNLIQKWQLQGCCALNGQGLFEGLDWLAQQMNSKK